MANGQNPGERPSASRGTTAQNETSKAEGSAYASAYRAPEAAEMPSPPPSQPNTHAAQMDTRAADDDGPPPAYTEMPGQIDNDSSELGTNAIVADDGRVNIRINQKTQRLSRLLPQIQKQLSTAAQEPAPPPPYIPEFLGGAPGQSPPPPLNVVIHVVGSRGDVQPFIALGKVLKETYNHRVRLATHPVFKDFVTENGLEFFSIGGDPAELMAFMVKNPGLMPGFDVMRSGDIGKRRKGIAEILSGTWRSCIAAGDGLGVDPLTQTAEEFIDVENTLPEQLKRPFVADAIIANPPSFGHVHCAEKLGIPLHIMFTMPWSPTQQFPHPLANIQSTNADANITNYLSYTLVDMLTWQGLGDIINRFRSESLSLEPIGMTSGPNMLARMKIPTTYCWSPALIPKPRDWSQHISIAGFFFLNLASNFTPEPALAEFLAAGEAPVYIGFGSIVVDDPNAMTKMIFEAVKKTGRRALVSKGWGGLGADDLGVPEGVFMLGNVPHDWLFKHVSAVVHHGGAGTTAAGIAAGRPTVVVPFFGDQAFWGAMTAKAGAGPPPIPYKDCTADKLADAITAALKPESLERAKELAHKISKEQGGQNGAQSFHQMLNYDDLRCMIAPQTPAVWRVRRTNVRLSAKSATILAQEGELTFAELKLFRPREYETDSGPWDPITGGATAIVGTATQMMMGVADFPIETLKLLNIHPDTDKKGKGKAKVSESGATTPEVTPTSHDQEKRPSISTQSSFADGKPAPPGVSTADNSKHGSRSNSIAAVDPTTPGTSGTPGSSSNKTGSNFSSRLQNMNAESAVETGKGFSRMLGATFKSPMDFTLNVSKGFHNVPKLYGGEVRQVDKVTDFQSGVKTAAKEFGLGLFEGISGLVTDPLKGAQKEGAVGFIKGVGRGIAGVPLRVMGGAFAVPGYTMQGLYKEAMKSKGAKVQNYIIAARISQGYDEAQSVGSEEKAAIVARWQATINNVKRKKNPAEGQIDTLSALMKKKKAEGQNMDRKLPPPPSKRPALHAPAPPRYATQASEDAERRELEAAVRASVSETSRGNPDEDELIAQAIKASIAELERPVSAPEDDEEVLQRVLKASLEEASRKGASEDEQRIIEGTLRNSLLKPEGGDQQETLTLQHGTDNEWDDSDTEDDEEYQRILAESKELADLHAENVGHPAAAAQEGGIPGAEPGAAAADDDELFRKAIADSENAERARLEGVQKQMSEEEIVMEYVKKQSLAEEEHRRRLAQGRDVDSQGSK